MLIKFEFRFDGLCLALAIYGQKSKFYVEVLCLIVQFPIQLVQLNPFLLAFDQ